MPVVHNSGLRCFRSEQGKEGAENQSKNCNVVGKSTLVERCTKSRVITGEETLTERASQRRQCLFRVQRLQRSFPGRKGAMCLADKPEVMSKGTGAYKRTWCILGSAKSAVRLEHSAGSDVWRLGGEHFLYYKSSVTHSFSICLLSTLSSSY